MFEQELTKNSTITRIRLYTLPLQISSLLIATFFVVQILQPLGSFGQLDDTLHPPGLRHTPLAIISHVDYQKKKEVIADLRKMYEGTKLDTHYVQDTLKQGKVLLSQIDTIYNITMPKIEMEEDPEASKKGITVSQRNEPVATDPSERRTLSI